MKILFQPSIISTIDAAQSVVTKDPANIENLHTAVLSASKATMALNKTMRLVNAQSEDVAARMALAFVATLDCDDVKVTELEADVFSTFTPDSIRIPKLRDKVTSSLDNDIYIPFIFGLTEEEMKPGKGLVLLCHLAGEHEKILLLTFNLALLRQENSFSEPVEDGGMKMIFPIIFMKKGTTYTPATLYNVRAEAATFFTSKN